MAKKAKDIAIKLYKRGAELAKEKGFIFIDTKYEFGIDEKGNLTNVEINRNGIRNNEIDEVVVTTLKSNKSSKTNSTSLAVLEAEAIRLISLLKGFTPAQKDGINVKSQFTFPINFQIGDRHAHSAPCFPNAPCSR